MNTTDWLTIGASMFIWVLVSIYIEQKVRDIRCMIKEIRRG